MYHQFTDSAPAENLKSVGASTHSCSQFDQPSVARKEAAV